MREIKEKVQTLLIPLLEEHQAYLVDVVVRNERGGKLIQVFVDTDKGVTIDECAIMSRELAGEMDRLNILETAYRLEVSSPGIDKPLTLLRQYQKNIGRTFRVAYLRAGTQTTVEGTLVSVGGDVLTFRPDKGESLTLRFSEITESKEKLPW